jgi:iron complex outermembrane recepter protein
MRRVGRMALLSALLGSVAQPALAQERSDSEGLEEVVVTATRRAENLQDVPIAITAITSDALEARGIDNIAEASALVPNLNLTHGRDASSQATIHIRGVGQSDEHGDPGVGIYVDGVFLARSYGALFDLYDLERVEVLRGPQGTLFGRNSIGGAISLVTKAPGNDREFSTQIGYESFDGFSFRGSASLPIVEDVLAARVSVAASNSEGFTRNALNGERLNDQGMLGGRLAVRYTPSANVEINAAVEMINDDANAPASFISSVRPGAGLDFVEDFIGPVSDYVIGGPAGVSVGDGERSIVLDASNDSALKVWGTHLSAEWDLGDFSLKSISAYREVENTIRSDLDGSPLVILDQRSEDMTQSQFSQEFQALGEAFGGRGHWLLGAYYFDEEQTLPIIVRLLPDLAADLDFTRTVNQTAESTAIFGSLTFDVTDQLSVTAGGRYTDETKTFNALRRTIVGGVVTFNEPGISASFNDFSPRVTVDYKFSDDLMVYATYSKGFKSGGFNTRASSSGQTQFFRPEEVVNYEAGFKSRFVDDRVQLNVSLFHMDYADIQQQAFFVNSSGDLVSSVTNAAEATVQGAEMELEIQAVEGLTFNGVLGYTDASFDKFVDANLGDISDLEFQNTPELTANIGAQYEFGVGANWGMRLNADYSYQSKVYYDQFNAEEIAQGSYGLLNASASLSSEDEAIEISLFARNIADEVYRVSGVNLLDDFGYGLNYYGEPRVVGVRLKLRN